MTSYDPSETVSKIIYFKDKDGDAVDPDSETTKVYDSAGAYKATVTLNKQAVGQYEFNYTLPNDAIEGVWKIECEATYGGHTEIENEYFWVNK